MSIPLYVFVQGDTLGLLVLAPRSETVEALAERLARAAAPRVALQGPLRVLWRGAALREDLTVAEAGLLPLDRVDLVGEQSVA